jgi:outer membrane receptor protein involved in Fe transport
VVFRPWPDQAFRLGYGLAFRKPSFFESQVHIDVREYNEAFKEIVDTLAEQVGNPGLHNETVHSFELGWKISLLEDRLDVSVDLFYNIYRDFIAFDAEVPIRMGLPDIQNSELIFKNRDFGVDTLGGEAEVVFRPDLEWTLWANVGLRRAALVGDYGDSFRGLDPQGLDAQEPKLRLNLGVSLSPQTGPVASGSLHYVSRSAWPLVEPDDQVKSSQRIWLGNTFLLLARGGYRFGLGHGRVVETGFTVRTPLGAAFTEHPGLSMPLYIDSDTRSDFAGEPLTRLVSLYLRGAF